jgi:glycosyltransferase involved in cell wall biosynthesis
MLKPLLGDGVVIVNGVDTDIFYPREVEKYWDNIRIFYSKFSRNETKQFHEVQYWWREYNLEKRDDILILAGKFADDYRNINHPFDFHNDENFAYKGVITDQKLLADLMRECDVAFLPYQFDACSNTVLEAQACGLPVIYSKTGGTPEIVKYGFPIDYDNSPVSMVKIAMEQRKAFSKEDFEFEYGLETMGEKYNAVIQLLSKPAYDI